MYDSTAPDRIAREFQEHFGAKEVFFVTSGKTALLSILQALREGSRRRKVVLPAYTCYSVPSAVLAAGLDVATCDVDEGTLDFDFEHLARIVDEDTLCVVPTHLFGIPTDVDRVRELCARVGAIVVEDAAQGMGARRGGRPLGTLGDVGFFSLGRGKNLTCHSGGVILTSDPEIAGRLRSRIARREKGSRADLVRTIFESLFLAVFLRPSLYWLPSGIPFLELGVTKFVTEIAEGPLDPFRAGLLHNWQGRLERFNEQRTRAGRTYVELLGLQGRLRLYSIDTPFLRFPVYARDAETKREICLRGSRLGISPMYPDTIGNLDPVRRNSPSPDCERAATIAATLLTLPTHEYLREEDLGGMLDLLRGRLADPETHRICA